MNIAVDSTNQIGCVRIERIRNWRRWGSLYELNFKQIIHDVLHASVLEMRQVKGGDIGHSLYVKTVDAHYFVKYRIDLPGQVFAEEAEGLRTLGEVGALAVPKTYYAGEIPGVGGGMIVLEWIDVAPVSKLSEEQLGIGLAAIHQTRSPNGQYGFASDNHIGELPQHNGWRQRWPEFYREQRLMPMVQTAQRKGLLPASRQDKLIKLMDRLERFIPDAGQPGLLHGDLWSGNWLSGPEGRPYLIDPAVYYGEREVEMAFSELFGGFGARFYEAYRASYPLDPGYADRRPLYQLYYLLVHLILFGEAYGPAVDRVLSRYV